MSRVGVLILNYKNYQDTQECIESVYKSDLPKGSKVYVLDNSSDATTLRSWAKKNQGVMVIDNGGNLGFAGGNNPGIMKAIEEGMEYVMILNPDVRLAPEFFGAVLKEFLRKKEMGLVAPALRHKQKDKMVFGLEGHLDWSLMKATHRNVERIEDREAIEAEFVTFACVVIRREVFDSIGLLDERFFMYLEDVDFCLRAKKAGYRLALLPQVVCDHRTSGSFSDPRKKLPISYISQIKFCDKYLTGYKKVWAIAYYSCFYPYLYLLWSWHRYKQSRGI